MSLTFSSGPLSGSAPETVNYTIDVDPTNNLLPATRHIAVAYGRDYNDVSPIRGVILGAGEHRLDVVVDVVALGETAESE